MMGIAFRNGHQNCTTTEAGKLDQAKDNDRSLEDTHLLK